MSKVAGLRSSFLLGAGASRDAGLPVSAQLTEQISARIDRKYRRSPSAQALHIVVSLAVAYDTGRGGHAFRGIDVERAFSAVQMLGQRDHLEISPFVSTWNANLNALGVTGIPSHRWAVDFQTAMSGQSGQETKVRALFAKAVQGISGASDIAQVFKQLEVQMIEALIKELDVRPEKVDYLAPLLCARGGEPINIATLNYDRSIELLAGQAGSSLDTGIGSWSGGFNWAWSPEAQVRLLKLHGSLDWAFESDSRSTVLNEKRVVSLDPSKLSGYSKQVPAVVFGQLTKLRADGPFLAMLIEFDAILENTDRLVVVGYSFRDPHINELLRKWINSRPSPTLVVIDPALDEWEDKESSPSFYWELVGARDAVNTSGKNFSLVKMPVAARDGLKSLLGDGPPLES